MLFINKKKIKVIFFGCFLMSISFFSSRFFLKDNLITENQLEQNNVRNLFENAFEIGKSGNHNDAILAYSKVIKSDPNNYQSYFNRAWHQGEIGNHDEAIIDYGIAINLNSGDYKVFYNRGHEKLYNNDIEGSCSDFLKAYDLGDYDALKELENYCYKYV